MCVAEMMAVKGDVVERRFRWISQSISENCGPLTLLFAILTKHSNLDHTVVGSVSHQAYLHHTELDHTDHTGLVISIWITPLTDLDHTDDRSRSHR